MDTAILLRTNKKKGRPITFQDGDAGLVNTSYTGVRLFVVMQYKQLNFSRPNVA